MTIRLCDPHKCVELYFCFGEREKETPLHRACLGEEALCFLFLALIFQNPPGGLPELAPWAFRLVIARISRVAEASQGRSLRLSG
jgi:hypothetical protein